MPLHITPLSQTDSGTVENLLDAAFGTDRHNRTAYRIRDGMTMLPDLSFAAYRGNALAGTLQSWPVALFRGVDFAPLVLIGPVAVLPSMQSGGIGRALMMHLLERTPADAALIMIGDPEYYGRFGFSAHATQGWQVPGPIDRHRLLARTRRALPAHGMLGPRTFAIAQASA